MAFPLDFQKDLYIRAAVAPYGRLLEWYKDDNKSRILAQVLLLSPNRVPRSLIVSRGTMIGGMGRSWSVPAFILNGHFPDAFPADEDLVPFDGDAHPEHPPIVLGPHPQQDSDWQEEHNGAAEGLGAFGGDPHPQNQIHAQIDHVEDNMDIDEEDQDQDEDGWPAWDPAIFATDQPQQHGQNAEQAPPP